MRVNILAVLCGLFIWIIFAVFNPFQYGVESRYIFWLSFFITPVLAGIFTGLIGIAKGWKLALLMQLIIVIIFMIFLNFDPFVKEQAITLEESEMYHLIKPFLYFCPSLLLAATGGHIGDKLKSRNSKKKERVRTKKSHLKNYQF